MKRIRHISLLLLLSALFIGCEYFDGLPYFQTEKENGRKIITLPDGRRFKNTRTTANPIEERFLWGVPTFKEDLAAHHIGYASGGERIYETKVEYCLHGWTPDGGSGGLYFDESFVFPRPIVTNFGKVVLSVKGEETVLTDKPCIQAFLYRMLASKYDVKEESVETEEYVGTITFYSEEYPKLKFSLLIYAEKDKEKYYIMDWPNEDWIECTDIIEQYFSEYFE